MASFAPSAVEMRRASAEDLGYILETEAYYKTFGYVGGDPQHVHEQRIHDPDAEYFLFLHGGVRSGYVILRGVAGPNRNIELKRIVIDPPERGVGRIALRMLLRYVFEEKRAHRIWLDVYVDNARAQHVYRSIGFVEEGVIREAVLRGDTYRSMILMSMLDREYAQLSENA